MGLVNKYELNLTKFRNCSNASLLLVFIFTIMTMSKYIIKNMVDSLTQTKDDNVESLAKLDTFDEQVRIVRRFLINQRKFYINRQQDD